MDYTWIINATTAINRVLVGGDAATVDVSIRNTWIQSLKARTIVGHGTTVLVVSVVSSAIPLMGFGWMAVWNAHIV